MNSIHTSIALFLKSYAEHNWSATRSSVAQLKRGGKN
jgi:hypothetical protein